MYVDFINYILGKITSRAFVFFATRTEAYTFNTFS